MYEVEKIGSKETLLFQRTSVYIRHTRSLNQYIPSKTLSLKACAMECLPSAYHKIECHFETSRSFSLFVEHILPSEPRPKTGTLLFHSVYRQIILYLAEIKRTNHYITGKFNLLTAILVYKLLFIHAVGFLIDCSSKELAIDTTITSHTMSQLKQ